MAKRKLTKRADGRYQSQIYLGTDENGKRIIKTLYGRTQKELEEKECLLKVKLSRGFDIKAERKTFGEWAELFLRMKESKNVSAGRLANYGYALMKFEPLYQYPLEKLYPIDFQRIIDSWAKENPNTGKPSSKALLTEMKRAANGVYRMAISNRVVEFNPIADVEISAIQKKEPKRILTEEEQRWIREMPHRAQAAAMIMLYAGLRRGELVALLWSDLNLQTKTLTVSKSVSRGKGELVVTEPKTENSVREIYLSDEAIRLLVEDRKNHPFSPYMFPSPKTGGMYGPDCVGRIHKKLLEKAGIEEHVRFHDLRHTFSTLAIQSGIDPKTVAEILGHASAEFSLDVYTHVTAGMKKEAAQKISGFMASVG